MHAYQNTRTSSFVFEAMRQHNCNSYARFMTGLCLLHDANMKFRVYILPIRSIICPIFFANGLLRGMEQLPGIQSSVKPDIT